MWRLLNKIIHGSAIRTHRPKWEAWKRNTHTQSHAHMHIFILCFHFHNIWISLSSIIICFLAPSLSLSLFIQSLWKWIAAVREENKNREFVCISKNEDVWKTMWESYEKTFFFLAPSASSWSRWECVRVRVHVCLRVDIFEHCWTIFHL